MASTIRAWPSHRPVAPAPARHHRNHPHSRPARASSSSSSSSYEKTWSNPSGSVLDVVVADKVFACARPFIWNDIDVGGRMGIVKLATDGSVWVHSPIELDERTRAAVDALGVVRHVVSPNYEHLKYAQQWKDAYPDATLYACPGLKSKRPDISYDVDLEDGVLPATWWDEFEMEWFDCEATPVVGGAFFNEVVFHHKPSRALFVTDVFWNYPAQPVDGVAIPLGTKLWKALMDKVYLPIYQKVMVTNREKFEKSARRVCDEFQWDVIVPCHGTIESGARARAMFRDHLLRA